MAYRKKIEWVVVMTFLSALCSLTAFSGTADRQAVRFTTASMDFYGCVEGGNVGDRLTVFDEQGTLCGQFTLIKEGQYGFVPVYGDDRGTTVDEGADVGSPLSFYLNGTPVVPVRDQNILWMGDGNRQQVDFRRK